ncbi:MAG TPA: prepilin-type N-terminal cleavage/methylation domain-containing protein [Polyangiaceae bacterium]|nr:prepilin-type N-terminal cleavage/methylation domain-containing protein [Polyangiaceae bacterium]
MTTPRRAPRGYTVIEVMIALTLLAIGTTGVIAMQKATAVGNRDAKNLVIANQIARTWMERLRADALQWNHPSPLRTDPDLADTRWLNNNITGQWFRPADDVKGSPTFDALGNDVRDVNSANGVFCTNVRLTWLYGPESAPPPYLVRTEVRVYWLRDGGGGVVEAGKPLCPTNPTLALVSPAVQAYHFVYVTSAIAQNMAR